MPRAGPVSRADAARARPRWSRERPFPPPRDVRQVLGVDRWSLTAARAGIVSAGGAATPRRATVRSAIRQADPGGQHRCAPHLPQPPSGGGPHHIALVTRDLDATVRFYHDVLGMRLVAALGPEPYHGPHVFLAAGTFLVHLFGQPDHDVTPAPAGWHQGFHLLPGAFQARGRT